ncbi:TetR/AcrR family transcriptional regulator [Rhodococcus triatomae]|uniref:DNA-binding transcriptional regulator, AcrR family n=1 Tax=Rhodococcus triatomae TaxID=300028 RepID=A0A1G8FR84_9NOCA|nr:TetR/AcrR family transcriptional regulator [Rhodococcus triatomae]QNG19555.1 TetR/AcrR family transcriptional regulator [Rhodococcus triatomae]QNG24530.1 TetR/AcrR family transcriptional regulator [Rhodococcus triatomae]SDH84662.1 DNA-binding transcriptional regulator, AcrR family [Rhodococcus triatomae]
MTAPRTRAVRGDARRNRERILVAARDQLCLDPRAGMSEIAEQAGIGRVTLYGHFASRKDLVAEVFRLHLAEAERIVSASDPGQSPPERLAEMIHTSWQVMAEVDGLIAAAETELGTEHVHADHARILGHVEELIRSGIESGHFRTAQSPRWLTHCFFALMHGTAAALRTTGAPTDSVGDDLTVTLSAALGADTASDPGA